jgi:hypothetical protein
MRVSLFVVLFCWLVAMGFADEAALPAAAAHQVLAIDRSSMKIPGGKATLVIGSLRRTNDVFGGVFQMKVAPYFFKNDQGTLAITITEEMIAKAIKGATVDITGTATTKTGKNEVVRDINAVATPVDGEHGALKLWFMVDERKMVFDTKYRFVE